jgi:3-oxoadipate enol-lactonase
VLPLLGREAVAFDNRGTGLLAAEPARDSIAGLAEDALAHVDDPADLVGLSMGGYVALTIALSRPEAVRSLVLAGSGAGGPNRVPRPPHVAAAFTAALGLPHERFEAILAARLEHPTPYATIEAHAAACYAFYAAGCEAERVEQPALVVHGAEDLIVPVENGRRLAERLPNAEYVELERRGHNLPLEDPERFARLVREFLG